MLTLYEHPFALYCQKVLVALNELGVAGTWSSGDDLRHARGTAGGK